MHKREYAPGVLSFLNDQSLLDAATDWPEAQWSILQNADRGADSTFGGSGGAGGAVGPEVLTWRHLAHGYCGRDAKERFITEVGLHTQGELDLAPIAAAIGLEPSPDAGAYSYRLDVKLGFPNFHGSDDMWMLASWLKSKGIGGPLGAANSIAGRLTWVRRHWRLKQQAPSWWQMMTDDKPSVNYHLIESDLLTWAFDVGDATTQFVARPIRPSTADGLEREFKKTIDAARALTDRVHAKLCHVPVDGETIRRRLASGDQAGGTQSKGE